MTPQKAKAVCIFSEKVIIYVWKKQNLKVYDFNLRKEASHHPAFMGICPTISHTY